MFFWAKRSYYEITAFSQLVSVSNCVSSKMALSEIVPEDRESKGQKTDTARYFRKNLISEKNPENTPKTLFH